VIEAIRPRERIAIERVAVAGSVTTLPLFLCDDADTHSTMSEEWIAVAAGVRRLSEKRWTRSVVVPTTTLDSLVERYGCPQFIKIDVEGFEREVLTGLSHLPAYLSFEFITDNLANAVECIRLLDRPDVRFNLTVSDPAVALRHLRLELSDWVPAHDLCEVLRGSQLREADTYGEIFVRRG
jgi:FkbM family methyltransferase